MWQALGRGCQKRRAGAVGVCATALIAGGACWLCVGARLMHRLGRGVHVGVARDCALRELSAWPRVAQHHDGRRGRWWAQRLAFAVGQCVLIDGDHRHISWTIRLEWRERVRVEHAPRLRVAHCISVVGLLLLWWLVGTVSRLLVDIFVAVFVDVFGLVHARFLLYLYIGFSIAFLLVGFYTSYQRVQRVSCDFSIFILTFIAVIYWMRIMLFFICFLSSA